MFTIALLSLLATASPAPAPAPEIHILEPGHWHGDEVSAQDGEAWFALVRRADGYHLVPTPISVAPAVDELLDGPGEATGKRVGAAVEGEVVLLVQGVPGLAARPVRSDWQGHRALEPGASHTVSSAEALYTLQAYGRHEPHLDPYDHAVLRDYRLVLVRSERRARVGQELIAHESLDDALPSLRWAGDLDGDGALDLLVDTSDHYNVRQPTLYLSSLAGPGELVRRAAAFRTTGC